MTLNNIIIYSDGSCLKDGIGGYASIVLSYDCEKLCYIVTDVLSGYDTITTAVIMEITAIVEALERIKTPSNISVYCDQIYLVNFVNSGTISDWMNIKRVNGDWKMYGVLYRLAKLLMIHKCQFFWIKSHSYKDNNLHDTCDYIAGRMARSRGKYSGLGKRENIIGKCYNSSTIIGRK